MILRLITAIPIVSRGRGRRALPLRLGVRLILRLIAGVNIGQSAAIPIISRGIRYGPSQWHVCKRITPTLLLARGRGVENSYIEVQRQLTYIVLVNATIPAAGSD